jgi:hypothetical protein
MGKEVIYLYSIDDGSGSRGVAGRGVEGTVCHRSVN